MTFLDEAAVEFSSGTGGSGAVSFHREKFVPLGGPNGADGGRGGDIVLIADRHKRTLYDFKLQSKFVAESGGHGMGNKRGANGKNVEVKLPVGTVIVDSATGKTVVDLTYDKQSFVICHGGKGGKGNQHFANSVRQAPNFAQKGAPGEKIHAQLTLKLLADVGLVGLPNAGKSTLISRISSSKPKIADYPFTTIVPNLGVVRADESSFVVADMPGLIQGANEGIGLGHQFLRHIERTKLLVHVVDSFPFDESDPLENFHTVQKELSLYGPTVNAKPMIIALNKIDLVPPGEYGAVRTKFEDLGFELFPISAVTGDGLTSLTRAMASRLAQYESVVEEEETISLATENKDDDWWVEVVDDRFLVSGSRIERLVSMTDLSNDEALQYMHRRLERIGVIGKLRELGAVDGDTVAIGDIEFDFEGVS